MKSASALLRGFATVFGCLAPILAAAPVFGQLYSQNFDVDNQSGAWTVTAGPLTPTPVDEAHDFFYDYSVMGIPSAPHSTGGTTRGMQLKANMFSAVFGGVSVSPNGQSFTGNYKVSFDLWSNYLGAAENGTAPPDGVNPIGTTTGSTMLSTYGILTSGTFANRAGSADGVFFSNTGDASTTAFRMYSSERPISYQLPYNLMSGSVGGDLDNQMPDPQPIDSHAIYYAGTRSNNPTNVALPASPIYLAAFPPATVPAAQTAAFPETQFGQTQPGSIGFKWHSVEIIKLENTITWKIDGIFIGGVDMTNYKGDVINFLPPTGTNISFGHVDVNAGISTDPYYDDVSFTLIDNINVQTVVATAGDFNTNTAIDGTDFLTWQANYGLDPATVAKGDANNDQKVDDADFGIWKTNFGTVSPAVAAGVGVPEPANWCSAVVAALVCLAARTPRRRLALQPTVS